MTKIGDQMENNALDFGELASSVSDARSLLEFVKKISEEVNLDREHGDISAYLEACSAWGLDTLNGDRELLGANPWAICAHIILAGSIYE